MTTEAYSTTFAKLADLKDAVGKEIGLTDWVEIDQKRINDFAETTEDRQWIHVDVERSKQFSPYKTTVAHGFLVLSLAPKFSYEAFKVGDVVMGVNYGLNKVRFPNATPVGAKVRGRISLIEFSEIPRGARYVMSIVFEQEGQEKPSCVAEMVAQAYTG